MSRRWRVAWLLGWVWAGWLSAAEPVAPPHAAPGRPTAGPEVKPAPEAETAKPAPADLPKPTTDKPAAAKPEPGRKKAFIRALEPNSLVKTGADHSVVARGKLQMVLPDDNVVIYCGAVDYSGETEGLATATVDLKILTGDIVVKDGLSTIPKPENVITGAIAWIWTKEKRAVIDGDLEPKVEGKTIIVHNPKEAEPANADRFEKAKYQPSKLLCDRLTYWYRKGDRKALTTPKAPHTTIEFEQPDQRGSAGKATYYMFEKGVGDLGDVVDLTGGVKVTNHEGESIRAEAARLFIDQNTSQWYNVYEVIINFDEQVNPNEPGGPPKTPGGTAGAGAPPPPPVPAAPPTLPVKP